MTARGLAGIDAASYKRHPLHGADRTWAETNCYADLWIELLHALGCDPVPGLVSLLSCDFNGEQWDFYKYEPELLRSLYGIGVGELNVWRSIEDHIAAHLAGGNLLTVETDAWYLPDTAGSAYGRRHQKTTIVVHDLDPEAGRIGYFHNAGRFDLDGADYRGVFGHDASVDRLVPYVELIRLDGLVARPRNELHAQVEALASEHLARAPSDNPVERLGRRLRADLDWLVGAPIDEFHTYAFGMLRQPGSWAELTADLCDWIGDPVSSVADDLRSLATTAKTAQFQLARVVAGRRADLDATIETMAEQWQRAYDRLRPSAYATPAAG